jgi:protein TorT
MLMQGFRKLFVPGLLGGCMAAVIAQTMPPTVKFAPVPVQAIFHPLQPNGSADNALASGRVVAGAYPMAAKASKRWRIAFLFLHLKDPY